MLFCNGQNTLIRLNLIKVMEKNGSEMNFEICRNFYVILNNTIENVRWILLLLVQMGVYVTLMVMFCSVPDKTLHYD